MANADVFSQGFYEGQTGKSGFSRMKNKKSRGVKQITTSDKQTLNPTPSYKRGGKVRKTGVARLHKGELVLTAAQAKGYGKSGNKKSARKKAVRKA